MKTTSRFAIAAVASVFATGAMAADLGGSCCADLEERVAELEATTVRKGNRKVSVTVSGWVNEMIMFWDDGREKNAYVSNNNHNTSRFRFTGDAKITPKMSAGFLLEIGTLSTTSSDGMNQIQDDNQNTSSGLQLRHNAWWVEHKDYGRVWLGRTDDATTGIQSINLANTGNGDGRGLNNVNGGFRLRGGVGASAVEGITGMSALTWNNLRLPLASNGNVGSGEKYSVIKYVSPVVMGFIVSAAWGEDDRWDMALRYAGEFSGFKLAGGVGYGKWSDGNIKAGTATATAAGVYGDGSGGDFGCMVNKGVATSDVLNKDVDCSNFGASGSLMHVGTGLFVSGGYGKVQDNMKTAGNLGIAGYTPDKVSDMWWVQAGIEQNWFGIGKTSLYGGYQQQNSGELVTNGASRTLAAADTLNGEGVARNISNVTTNRITLGINQSVDAAAMDIYVYYARDSADISLRDAATGDASKSLAASDMQMVIMGTMIKF